MAVLQGTKDRPQISDVESVSRKVTAAFPGSEMLKVEPQGQGYHSLIVSGQSLMDVLIDQDGNVVSKQVRDDEFEWFWNADDDEAQEWKESH
ncbi:TPA: hypothetical protein DEB00_01840 [Candidatus Uhrbacteria bacterium]|nr:hypothetical protein [Candidatus Uhrbacteria bacterium]